MSDALTKGNQPLSDSKLDRIVAVYRRIDNAVFTVEAGLVTAATGLMTLFILLNILFSFANGQAIAISQGSASGQLGSPSYWVKELLPTLIGGGAVVAMVVAGVFASLPDRSKGVRLAVAVALSALFFGFLAFMLKVPPKWACTLLAVVASVWFAIWLWKSKGGPIRWGVCAIASAASIAFCLSISTTYSAWTQSYALFLLVWTGFMGGSMATSQGRHLRIDAVRKAVPERHMAKYNALSFGVAAAFTGAFAFLAIAYTAKRIGSDTVEGDIPEWIRVAPIPTALVLITLRFASRAVLSAMGHVETLADESSMASSPRGDE
ncbi:MAG: TRAP transporter small permease [Myxococcales bacterium]|nr:TRAP transporter small permease [Myxococcales bacterium]